MSIKTDRRRRLACLAGFLNICLLRGTEATSKRDGSPPEQVTGYASGSSPSSGIQRDRNALAEKYRSGK